MVFSNAYNVYDHINNNIDTSIFPEETHNILQGNIGSLIAGNNRLHVTKSERPSMLGIVGDIHRPENIIVSKTGKTESHSGRMINVPKSFYDDSTPLFTGESGYGIDWEVLNNSKNNIGYSLDFNGNRTLGFPYHAVSGTEIGVMSHYPPIELIEKNGKMMSSWEPISKAFPGLSAPVGDWTKISSLHNFN